MTAATCPTTNADVVETHYHAGRLHALVVSLVCINDTPQQFEDAEKDDIRSWLISMARSESCLLRLCLNAELDAAAGKGGAQ
jgi:hypothetical protein